MTKKELYFIAYYHGEQYLDIAKYIKKNWEEFKKWSQEKMDRDAIETEDCKDEGMNTIK